MFTRDERRALVFLAAVAAAGGVMRAVRAPAAAPGAAVLSPDMVPGDVARQARLAREALELARPLLPGERVDVDRASAAELERLPRVGPELARRIVADREAHGPFGSLEALGRVPGIGPQTLRGFERTASFSGSRTPGAVPAVRAEGPAPGSRLPSCTAETVSLNAATAAELACLPGIGEALAAQIVTWRTAHGGFREVKELERVPGIGAARFARLSSGVRVP